MTRVHLIIVFMLSFCQVIYASDCRVVETAEKVEVVCEGTPVEAAKKNNQIEAVSNQKRDLQNKIVAEETVASEIARKIDDKKSEIEDLKEKFRKSNEEFKSRHNK